MSVTSHGFRYVSLTAGAGFAGLPGQFISTLKGSNGVLLIRSVWPMDLYHAELRLPGLFTGRSGMKELRTNQPTTDCCLSGSPKPHSGSDGSAGGWLGMPVDRGCTTARVRTPLPRGL
jgi:hypothetical protein